MPRAPRLDIPGFLHHVMVRGIEGRDIFCDDDDRHFFVDRFSSLLVATGTSCYAWALMPNHLHLLVRPHATKLATFMGRLLTSYATFFNHRHQRQGHLFQNRYRSIVCHEDSYLLELVRYIHLNPIRGQEVHSLQALAWHRWSGHSILMGKQTLKGQEPDAVLYHFGRNRREARERYLQFMADGIPLGKQNELTNWADVGDQLTGASGDPRVLGPVEFMEELRRRNPGLRPVKQQRPIQEIIEATAAACDIPVRALTGSSRRDAVVQARSLVCKSALDEGYSAAEIARWLGMSRYGVTVASKRKIPER